jgi:hypothetical protein
MFHSLISLLFLEFRLYGAQSIGGKRMENLNPTFFNAAASAST